MMKCDGCQKYWPDELILGPDNKMYCEECCMKEQEIQKAYDQEISDLEKQHNDSL